MTTELGHARPAPQPPPARPGGPPEAGLTWQADLGPGRVLVLTDRAGRETRVSVEGPVSVTVRSAVFAAARVDVEAVEGAEAAPLAIPERVAGYISQGSGA